MTIHAPRSAAHAWYCPRCRTCKAGYPSESAAIRAEARHTEKAHPARKAVAR